MVLKSDAKTAATERADHVPVDEGRAEVAGAAPPAGASRSSTDEAALRLRAIFDHTFQFMGLLDPSGTILEANRSALEFGGLTREEVVGRPFWDTSWWGGSEDVRAQLRAAIAEAAAGGFVRYEVEVCGAGGRSAMIDFSLNPVRDETGAVVLLVPEGRDIGDARRAERDLRVSREKYAGIVATSADAIITIDESQRITDFNRGAERVFGWTAEEVLGRPLDMLLPERHRRAHAVHVREFGQSAETARRMGERRDISGLRKNGEEFPADASILRLDVVEGRIFTVVLRDITEQKRAQAVQAFLARAGGMLAASLDVPTVHASVAQLAVEFVAESCEIFEMQEGGRAVRVAVAAADPGRAMAFGAVGTPADPDHPAWAALDTGEAQLLADLDGPGVPSSEPRESSPFSELPVRSAMMVPLRPRGRTAGVIGFYSSRPRQFGVEDLALARELAARAALAVDNARLYQAARDAVQARDDVLAVVSHDLGNPLSAIRIGVSLLLRGRDTDAARGDAWEHLAGIKQSVEQMERLIRDLLDVKRIEAGQLALHRKRIRPAALVDATVEMMAPLARDRDIDIRTHVQKPLPPVAVDRDRIIQALANLVGNALKFAPRSGNVFIGCRSYDGEVFFEVTDDGPGIDARDLEHIFDRYWQATHTRVEGGLGLGLAIVKGIVHAHGGHVWAESEPGSQTTVGFALRQAHDPGP